MKFIVDAQLPPALCIWLNGKGHEAQHVYDLGLGAAPDHIIVEHVSTEEALLVSKDEDFLVLRLPDRFGLIWVRIGNATTRHLISWLEARWDQVETLLKSGERLIELR